MLGKLTNYFTFVLSIHGAFVCMHVNRDSGRGSIISAEIFGPPGLNNMVCDADGISRGERFSQGTKYFKQVIGGPHFRRSKYIITDLVTHNFILLLLQWLGLI